MLIFEIRWLNRNSMLPEYFMLKQLEFILWFTECHMCISILSLSSTVYTFSHLSIHPCVFTSVSACDPMHSPNNSVSHPNISLEGCNSSISRSTVISRPSLVEWLQYMHTSLWLISFIHTAHCYWYIVYTNIHVPLQPSRDLQIELALWSIEK